MEAEKGVFAIRLPGRGDLTRTHLLWRYEKTLPNVPSPLLYRNVLYLVKEGGIVVSLDCRTGAVLKQGRLTGAPGPYFASPVAADGKVFAVSQEGKITVLKAGGEWQVLAVNPLAEECYATPAIAHGRIYIRTSSALYCFAERR